MAKDFEEFPGEERGSDSEGEELAPSLLEVKTDAFDHGDSGVGKSNEADAAQDWIVDEGGFFQKEVDQARLGIEAEMAGEEVDLVGEVFVEEAVGAYTDADEGA